MKTYNWYWIAIILFLFSNNVYTQVRRELVPDVNGGTYYRSGNRIIYNWIYLNDTGQTIRYSLFIDFDSVPGDMKKAYLPKDHKEVNFSRFIKDDPFKAYLLVLARELRDLAAGSFMTEVDLALSFVQAFPYETHVGPYQRYAVETLIDARGDCSDTAILFAGILTAWNYDCIILKYPGHLAVGVWMANDIESGVFYAHRNRRFYFAETTGTGLKIGGPLTDGCYQAELEEVYYY